MIVMEKQDLRVLALLLQLKEQQVMLGYIQMDRTLFFFAAAQNLFFSAEEIVIGGGNF